MFSFWLDVFFRCRERACPVVHIPKARSPKIEDGSGTEVIRSNSMGVPAIKVPLAEKIRSNESMRSPKTSTLETTLPPELVGQPVGALFPI